MLQDHVWARVTAQTLNEFERQETKGPNQTA